MALDPSRVDQRVANLAVRIESAMLVACRTVNQTTAAQRLGISKQTHNDWMHDQWPRCALVLAAHGLKVVPADAPYVDTADLAAIGRLARRGIDKIIPAVPEATIAGGGAVEDEIDTVRGDL